MSRSSFILVFVIEMFNIPIDLIFSLFEQILHLHFLFVLLLMIALLSVLILFSYYFYFKVNINFF